MWWQLAIVFFLIAVAVWHLVSRVVRTTGDSRAGRCSGCRSGCSPAEPDLIAIKPLPKHRRSL